MQTVSRTCWYQEPWVWFNLILLTVAIIAACCMTIVAISHTPAALDVRWYKEGVLAKQQRQEASYIRDANLRAELSLSAGRIVRVVLLSNSVVLTGDQRLNIKPSMLNLYIEHPANATFDQTIKLTKSADGSYIGQLSKPVTGKRHLLISPINESWFLKSVSYFPSNDNVVFTPNQTGDVVGE